MSTGQKEDGVKNENCREAESLFEADVHWSAKTCLKMVKQFHNNVPQWKTGNHILCLSLFWFSINPPDLSTF